jgi:hypothetical protein
MFIWMNGSTESGAEGGTRKRPVRGDVKAGSCVLALKPDIVVLGIRTKPGNGKLDAILAGKSLAKQDLVSADLGQTGVRRWRGLDREGEGY